MFARIALDFYADKEFDYRIPASLSGSIVPGTRVEVPFGNARKSGTVIGLAETSSVGDAKIKDILAISPEISFLDPKMLELLSWVHRYYGGSMGKVMRAAVPAAIRSSKVKEAVVEWVEQIAGAAVAASRSAKDALVMERLAGAPGRMRADDLLDQIASGREVMRRLEKKGWIRVVRESVMRDVGMDRPIVFNAPKPVLNDEQRRVVNTLSQRLEEGFRCVLLYGVTGSGKTEVYLRAIERALEKGKTAMVLVPEISLTPQTIDRFRSRFTEPMAVLHSGLTEGQRFDQWRLIRRGEAKIVIGARSAVFAPLSNLGVIILDEEQERSFKQQEAPHYNARDVAVMRAKLENALVVLASATPSMESFNNAVQGKYELVELSSRVDSRVMPRIEILDMRLENTKSGAIPIMSARLAAQIQNRLDRKEQTMLFLNRRGYHRCMYCPTCAQALQCPHCSVALTFHRVGTKLLCHLCGYRRDTLSRCPTCAADLLIPQGYGTQKVEGIVRKWFPGAKVVRMDADTTQGKDAHREILSRFALGRYDILIGTQMIAKGHDFSNVTLVGVLNADMGLNIPDFRAGEQTFQLLTQVAGRAGRGAVSGEVIIQTNVPGHYVMDAVKAGDYKKFFTREMALREELEYPPKTHLLLVCLKHTREAAAQEAAILLHKRMKEGLQETAAVFSPVPAPIQKTKGMHRWQIMLKTHAVVTTQQHLKALLEKTVFASGVLVDVDVDPQVLS